MTPGPTPVPCLRRAGLAAASAVLASLLGLGVLAPRDARAAGDRPADYAASAPIRVPVDAAAEGLLRLRLPLAVLRHVQREDRADLRVFNARGEPVPIAWAGAPEPPPARWTALPLFAWPVAPPRRGQPPGDVRIEVCTGSGTVRVEGAGRTDAQGGREAGRTHWLLDLQALRDERPAALRLRWAERPGGLVRRLRVEASADASQWEAVGEATLLDVAAPAAPGTVPPPAAPAPAAQPLRQDEARLPPLPAATRYLRLVLDEPLVLTGVEAELRPPGSASELPPQALDRVRLRAERAGPDDWRLDLGASLAPREMQLHLPQLNSVVPFELAQRRREPPPRTGLRRGLREGPDPEWTVVARHTAYRLARAGAVLEAPPFSLQAPPAREWRLRPTGAAADGLGDGAPEVTFAWLPPELVFAARGPAPFTLAVGRAQGVLVALDRASLIPGYRPGDEFRLPAATLGEPAARPTVEPTLLQRLQAASPEDRRRWLLWAVLVGAVAGLGGLAWRLWREMSPPAAPREE